MKTQFSTHLEVGLDESGYGSGIGKLYVAGVIFPIDYQNAEINDSKKLKPEKRKSLVSVIEENAIEYHIATIDIDEIDKLNVYEARLILFHRCLDMFKTKFEHILIDGNSFHQYQNIKHTTIPKADTLYLNVAAASILAKVYRDEYVETFLDKEYPKFDWKNNKGYLTAKHIDTIKKYGITEYHRKSFLKNIQLINKIL